MVSKDFWYHIIVCFLISAICAMTLSLTKATPLTAITGGFISALFAGLAKEYGDSKAVGNYWSWSDIVADVIGALFGSQLGWIALIL